MTIKLGTVCASALGKCVVSVDMSIDPARPIIGGLILALIYYYHRKSACSKHSSERNYSLPSPRMASKVSRGVAKVSSPT